MAESFNLLRRVKSLDIAPELPGYSGVVIFAGQDDEGNNIEYLAGYRTGTVLEITNEWGSQAQADAIYQKIKGFKYQPYTASGTRIDPSAEIGDAVAISDIYGGVFSKSTTYGRHISTDLGAPSKEEVEHEFQIQSPTNRQYDRFTRTVRASLSITASKIAAEVEDRKAEDNLLRATLNIQAQEIEARVTKEGGDSSSDFWWRLLATGWDVGTGSKTVFSVKSTGAYVDGEIRVSSGKIGGFDIQSNYLSYNDQTWGGTNTTGIYAGPSGIQCGSAENGVRITSSGDLYANNGYFRGNVNAGNIKYGDGAGYFSGKGISSGSISGSRLVGNTITTAYTSEGINASLGYADYAYGCLKGWTKISALSASSLDTNDLTIENHQIDLKTISYMNASGGVSTAKVLVWV